MTNATEVRRWLRRWLGSRSDAELIGRNLVFKPIHHVVRGIFFDASWDATLCRPMWYVNQLCCYHGRNGGFSFQYAGRIYLKYSTEADFVEDLEVKIESALNLKFFKVTTLEQFVEATDPVGLDGEMYFKRPLSDVPHYWAAVAAGLGRISEAREVLFPLIERIEQSRQVRLAAAEREFVKRSNSAVGKLELEWADREARQAAMLRPLAEVLLGGDKTTIAALLRKWEAETATGWGLGHLWEPTPFPFERGAG